MVLTMVIKHKSNWPPRWLSVKHLPANAGDVGSISGSGRCPGEENDNSLQYSHLGNPLDRGDWWATVQGIIKGSQLSN